jgi:hypothetical protein
VWVLLVDIHLCIIVAGIHNIHSATAAAEINMRAVIPSDFLQRSKKAGRVKGHWLRWRLFGPVGPVASAVTVTSATRSGVGGIVVAIVVAVVIIRV